ncbi:hypothetical protein ARMGADRAFT_1160579 [Armillaria gallica]|uniref:Disintegrin domain-containing protein n=1 Tax=Armillaria gallica TaxID=47427 RepID=A0A2H3ECK4_ARMGA|nr:hypothetical protein ARMGADRAFT_1160579 [Armillaria gallica]
MFLDISKSSSILDEERYVNTTLDWFLQVVEGSKAIDMAREFLEIAAHGRGGASISAGYGKATRGILGIPAVHAVSIHNTILPTAISAPNTSSRYQRFDVLASKDSRCDTAKTCTGNSSVCPSDVVSPNGQSCGSGGLACASGQCTSVSLQCQSVGASMNLTTGCSNRNDQTCQVSCQDPSNSNQCVLLSSLLIDGSPCGYGGSCQSGSCKSGSAIDTAKAWYKQNLQIAIPVTIIAALIVLALLWALIRGIRRCMTRKRVVRTMRPSMTPTYSRLRHDRIASYDRAVPTYMGSGPPGREIYRSRANWVDENAYNGPRP